MKRFRFGLDPICLAACGLYLINRTAIKPNLGAGFFSDHFNDLLLIPAALPWVLWVQKWMRLRSGLEYPSGFEILFHLVIWSILAEVVVPKIWEHATADPYDLLAYGVGACAAWALWSWQDGRFKRDRPVGH